ncbi:MAG: hypothetical protein WKF75_11435 [Singulisphaera sp.]
MRFDPAILLDNPILTKHARSRLRLGELAPWVVVVLVLCLVIRWAGQAFDLFIQGTALAFLLGLQAILLVFVGATQVGGAIGGARASGIIDFHRVSPLPSSWMTLGFFLGAPIREYVLFACTLPFAMLLGVLSSPGFWGMIQVEIPLLFGAWILHAVALLTSLSSRKPRGNTRGGIIGIVILALILGQPIGTGIWFGIRRLEGTDLTLDFFGIPVYWLLFVVAYQAVALAFLLIAAGRKMRSERAHAYSKRLAIACMTAATVLAVGGSWNFKQYATTVLVLLYLLIFLGMVLTSTITPGRAEYVKALRRALHRGHRRPSPWEDAGTNRIAVFILCAILFLGTMAVWEFVGDQPPIDSATMAIGVFVLAYYGLAQQYFLLRFPKSGPAITALFIFLVWLVPVLVGSLAAWSDLNRDLYRIVLGISPVTGIALSSGLVDASDAGPSRLAAILPAIAFAFVFNNLLVAYRRKIDLAVRSAAGGLHEPGPFDDLDRAPDVPRPGASQEAIGGGHE